MNTERFPSIEKPWRKFYTENVDNVVLPQCTIYEYMHHNNEGHEKEIALEFFGAQISYGEMLQHIKEATQALSSYGVKEGDIVSFCSITTPEIIYSFYALNQLGAVANMIDPRTNTDNIQHYINSVHSSILIVLDMAYPKIKDIISQTTVKKTIIVSVADSMPIIVRAGYKLTQKKRIPVIPEDDTCLSWVRFIQSGANCKNVKRVSYHPNMPAAIVYTGGTTGMPKGAVLSNDAINTHVVIQKHSNVRMERGHKFLGFMPPFIAYGLVCGITNPLCLGLKIIIIPKFDPEKFDQLIKKHKPNHAVGVPSHWESLVKSKKLEHTDLSFIVNAITGGDKIDASAEAEINKFFEAHGCKYHLSKGYGMTEFSSTATYTVTDECNFPGSVGIPTFLNNAKVVNPGTTEELPYNTQGEICMTSPTMMLGYYDNKAETNRIMMKHSDGLTWIHTQDIGYISEDGVLFIVDRMKRMIVRHDGFKVFPSKIETVITHNENVQECAVVGVNDPHYTQGQNPIAFVVMKPNCSIKQEDLVTSLKLQCEQNLPDYSQPVDLLFVQSLPLTLIGKVDYLSLEKEAARHCCA